jgi:hypothetical protein
MGELIGRGRAPRAGAVVEEYDERRNGGDRPILRRLVGVDAAGTAPA